MAEQKKNARAKFLAELNGQKKAGSAKKDPLAAVGWKNAPGNVAAKGAGSDEFGNTVLCSRRAQMVDKGALARVQKREADAKSAEQIAEKSAALAAPGAGSTASEEARRKFTRIDTFEGPFDFLALDAPCDVALEGRVYASAAHALLAAQYPQCILEIEEAATANAARAAAEGGEEAKDWKVDRLKAMERVQRDKFRRSADFRRRLQETGDRELMWENKGDAFWGATAGKGQNQLGNILMDIRGSIQNDTEFETWLFLCCEMESEAIRRPPVELVEQKDTDACMEKKVHRLVDRAYFKFGKTPVNQVQANHPSTSREHAMLIHTKAWAARCSGGVALMDLGSKAGTSISGKKLAHSFVMQPLRNGDVIKIGASTRDYHVKVNLRGQIELLEQQERDLLSEVTAIDTDAANPIEAAKRAAREEATVFVGNLDFETEKADMLGFFQDCGGHVEDVRFPGAESIKAERGICFVVFDSAMAARRACGMNGDMLKMRRVKVAPATENRGAAGVGGADGKGKGKAKGKGKGKGKGGDGGEPGRADGDWKKDGPRSPSPQGSRAVMMAGAGRDGARRDREVARERSRSRSQRKGLERAKRKASSSCSSSGSSGGSARGKARRKPSDKRHRGR